MRALPLMLTALLLVAAIPAEQAHAGGGENLLSMLPADSVIVGAVNMQALRATPTWRHFDGIMQGVPEIRRARESMRGEGFNFEEAVETIAFGVNEVSNPENPSVLMVFEGNFPEEQMRTMFAADSSHTQVTHAERALFVTGDGYAAAPINDRTVLIGTRPLVEAAVTRVAAEESTRFGSAMRAQVRHADKSAVMWYAARVTSQMRRLNNDLVGVTGVAGSVNLRSGFAMTMRVETENEEVATRMVADFETSKARMEGSPELRALGLSEVVRGLAMTSDGTSATLNVTIAAERWNALIATIGALIESELR